MRDKLAEIQLRLGIIAGILERIHIDDEGRVMMPIKDIEILRYTTKQLKQAA